MKLHNHVVSRDTTIDDMIWMSYRYCIGRHTIASSMHAGNLAQFINDNKIDEKRKQFYSKDILDNINTQLKFMGDVSCPYLYVDILAKLMPYYNESDDIEYEIEEDGSVKKTEQKAKYQFSWKSLVVDLMPWYKLAKALDPDLEITTNYEGKEVVHKAFRYYSISGDECFVTVDKYLENPFIDCFIDSKYIVKVKSVK